MLADAIWILVNTSSLPEIQRRIQYVLDGGALIYHIPWVYGSTYKDICTFYTNYVRRKYGNANIVFDGYEGLSTKDITHQRRTKGQTGPSVTNNCKIYHASGDATF